MNIAIVGSRDFAEPYLVERVVLRWMALHPADLTVVSGGAAGADTFGERAAKAHDVPTIVHLPEWDKFGKSAGFKRNALIVRDADVVIAFFAGGPRSKGTANTVAAAKLAGKPVYEYHEGKWYSHTPLAL